MQSRDLPSRKKLRSLFEFWRPRLEQDRLPRRTDFSPEEFQPWMGNIGIVGVERDPLRFRLRLVGLEIVAYDGADFTGCYLDEVLKPPVDKVVLRQYEDCAESGRPMAFSYRTSGFRHVEAGIDKLFLPFSDSGETVSHIFVCLYASFIDPWSDERAIIQDYERDGGTVAFDPSEL
jgi:hypothetical protein